MTVVDSTDRWPHGLHGDLSFTCICGAEVFEARHDEGAYDTFGAVTIWRWVRCRDCERVYVITMAVTHDPEGGN